MTSTPTDDRAVDVVVGLAGRATPRCGDVLVVAVDGPSGAGKTRLARAVGRRLGARVVHMDDVYPGWDGLADAVPLVVEGLLEPLARGEDAAYRRWDWVHDRWATRRRDVRWVPRLVLEGVGSSVGAAGAFAALRVWVEAPRAVRFERGIARDGEAYRPHWERWARQEAALFAGDGTRSRADVVVDTTGAHRVPR
ncbi:(d)CMP kinase [Lapillicoccus jejuensis]|uniref:Uridine kinase n=1 Tax=Lapillicoccus jejuensis TaxID=402171 RepID=A0A542E6F6_9MICO|nr:(d)CMP kinase [Lapillicoccus jejuensis]TQJ10894.1 uridine kinase [Lapillicoccus jejuensis]